MTTIAYRDGVLAADSRGSISQWQLPGRETKLHRVQDAVAGITGDLGPAMTLLRWVSEHRNLFSEARTAPISKTPPVHADARVILLMPSQQLWVIEDGGAFIETTPFMAWGSGMPVALGAMHHGATAAEAVEIASRVDPWTGGQVWEGRPGTIDLMARITPVSGGAPVQTPGDA